MKKRIISAVIMLAISIPLLIIGGNPFLIFMGMIGCCGLYELIKLREKDDYKLPFLIKVISYLSMLYILFNNIDTGLIYLDLDYRLIALLVFVFLIPVVLIANDKKYSFLDGFYLMGSVLLVGLSLNVAGLIRIHSLNLFLYLLMITVFTDTFALVTGMFVGKTKLAPKISPKKTLEGLIGGTLMGTFIATVFYITLINKDIGLFTIVTSTMCLSLMGQLGDLVFSAIKRHYKVKDFSNLIPGHGGILDRFDSIIFVVLMYVFFIGII